MSKSAQKVKGGKKPQKVVEEESPESEEEEVAVPKKSNAKASAKEGKNKKKQVEEEEAEEQEQEQEEEAENEGEENGDEEEENSAEEEEEEEAPVNNKRKSADKQNGGEKKQKTSAGAGEGTTIFIGQVSDSVDDDKIKEFFSEVGEIQEIRWRIVDGAFKGCGWIDFDSAEAVEKALELNGAELEGRNLRIDRATPRGDNSARAAPPSEGLEVFLANFGQVDDDTVIAAVNDVVEPVSHRIIKDRETGESKGFGYFVFEDNESANKVVEALNGFELEGNTLKAEIARARDGGGRGGGRGGRGGGFGGRGGGGFGGRGGGGFGGRGGGFGGRGGGGGFGGRGGRGGGFGGRGGGGRGGGFGGRGGGGRGGGRGRGGY